MADPVPPDWPIRLDTLRADGADPHLLHGCVRFGGIGLYLRAWEVVDELQSPHPAMRAEHREAYEAFTAETTPGMPRTTVEIPGLPGRWVVVVGP